MRDDTSRPPKALVAGAEHHSRAARAWAAGKHEEAYALARAGTRLINKSLTPQNKEHEHE